MHIDTNVIRNTNTNRHKFFTGFQAIFILLAKCDLQNNETTFKASLPHILFSNVVAAKHVGVACDL